VRLPDGFQIVPGTWVVGAPVPYILGDMVGMNGKKNSRRWSAHLASTLPAEETYKAYARQAVAVGFPQLPEPSQACSGADQTKFCTGYTHTPENTAGYIVGTQQPCGAPASKLSSATIDYSSNTGAPVVTPLPSTPRARPGRDSDWPEISNTRPLVPEINPKCLRAVALAVTGSPETVWKRVLAALARSGNSVVQAEATFEGHHVRQASNNGLDEEYEIATLLQGPDLAKPVLLMELPVG